MAARARRLVGLAARSALPLFLAVLLMLSAVAPASAGSNTWTRLSGVGKQVGALAVAPSDPSRLYARTPQGLLRSTDRGRTWRLAGKRLGTYHEEESYYGWQYGDPWGLTVWVDPQDPRVVYSALDESRSYSWRGTAPTALFRSADGGTTWRRVLAGDGGQVAIYPADPRIVYVAGTYGIWKSVDRGLTWSQVYYLGARDLAISPTDSNLVLAIAGDYLVQSTDGGRTWSSLPTPKDKIFDGLAKVTVVGGGDQPVYWSVDGGETWAVGGNGFANPLDPSERFTPSNGKEDDTIAVVHYTNWGRYRDLLPYPPTQTYVQQLVLDRGSPQTMYALAEDGVWAYTFGEVPSGAGELPKTGEPDQTALPVLGVLAGALALAGLRLRRRGLPIERAAGQARHLQCAMTAVVGRGAAGRHL